MKDGDAVRATFGKHKGERGILLGRYIARGPGKPEGEEFSGYWFVKFEDGPPEMMHESLLELIKHG